MVRRKRMCGCSASFNVGGPKYRFSTVTAGLQAEIEKEKNRKKWTLGACVVKRVPAWKPAPLDRGLVGSL